MHINMHFVFYDWIEQRHGKPRDTRAILHVLIGNALLSEPGWITVALDGTTLEQI